MITLSTEEVKAAFITFLGLAGAAFYSLGYWSSFGIDPFPFMTAADFALYALKALLVSAFPFALAFCFGVFSKRGPKTEAEALVFAFPRDGILVVVGIALAFAGLLVHRRELLFGGLFFAVGSIASFRLVEHPLFSTLSDNRVLRHMMIVALFGVPVLGVGAGIASAMETTRNGSRVVETWTPEGRHLVGRVYLGHIGGHDFFWDTSTKVTEFVRSESVGGFSIRKASEARKPAVGSGPATADTLIVPPPPVNHHR